MSPLMQDGLNITAIGMGVVFVLLTSLVFIIRGMSALSRMLEGPDSQSKAASVAKTGAAPGTGVDQQLVAAIGAAIAAHRRNR